MDLNELKETPKSHSAVIVLWERSSDSLILTERNAQLRMHPGEICFPGGLWEEGDKNLYATGLRELYEELGIAAGRITLIKELGIEKTFSGTMIHPWLASIETINPFSLNLDEVVRLIFIPMSLVQDARNYRDLMVERDAYRYKSCEFTANENGVWGATARIMRQLTTPLGTVNE